MKTLFASLLLLFPSVAVFAQQSPPNVLFVIFDDLNDAPEPFGGHPQAITPNLEKLARIGVTFTNAASNDPLCAPSRASLLTGLYPSTTGYFDASYANEAHWTWRQFPALKNAKTMMEHFKDNGYEVYGTGKIFHNGEEDWSVWLDEKGKMQFGFFPSWGPFPWDGKKQYMPYSVSHSAAIRIPHPSQPDIWFLSFFTSLADVPNVPPDPANGIPGYSGWYELGQSFRYVSEDDRDLMADEKNALYVQNLLKKKHDKPFMICMGINRPHEPYVAPKKYFDLFPLETVQVPVIRENDLDDCAPDIVGNKALVKDKKEFYEQVRDKYGLQRWVQAYLACVAYADDQFGKVLAVLQNSAYAENTIIIITSDNGFHMGEKSRLYKNSPWEEASRIPFIVAGPGVEKGKKCTKPVSHIDIYPTLIDLCHLTKQPHPGLSLDGHSLKPLLEDPENGQWDGPDVALSMVCWPGNENADDKETHFTVRSERYRYVYSNQGNEELYDHQEDPYEWHNLAFKPELAGTKQRLKEQLFRMVDVEGRKKMKGLLSN